MKKEYKELELETVEFEAEDVITASGGGCDADAPCIKCDGHGCNADCPWNCTGNW